MLTQNYFPTYDYLRLTMGSAADLDFRRWSSLAGERRDRPFRGPVADWLRTGCGRKSYSQAFGHPCPVSDLFGVAGRRQLAVLKLPEPWAGDVTAALRLIEVRDGGIEDCEATVRKAGADHRYVPLLMTAPGIGWVPGYTSPPRSATSADSRRRRSWSATPGCARRWISPAGMTGAARWPRTARSTCAGR